MATGRCIDAPILFEQTYINKIMKLLDPSVCVCVSFLTARPLPGSILLISISCRDSCLLNVCPTKKQPHTHYGDLRLNLDINDLMMQVAPTVELKVTTEENPLKPEWDEQREREREWAREREQLSYSLVPSSWTRSLNWPHKIWGKNINVLCCGNKNMLYTLHSIEI